MKTREGGAVPATQPVGLRPEYLVDAGRSHAIDHALRPVLTQIRRLAEADIGVVVYQPETAAKEVIALASSGGGTLDPPLPSEPLRVARPLPRHRPHLLQDLKIASPLRPYQLLLRSAVVVPWTDASGVGAVIVGNDSSQPLVPVTSWTPQARRIAAALSDGRRAGARRINRDLRRAVSDVADAAVASADVSAALAAMLVAMRDLFGADVAYLSLPDHDVSTFAFDQMMGIRTTDFRHLRIEMGQGLGGLARSLRHPVRSLDYASDGRLQAAPVAETVREGIVSAMASPVIIEEDVQAVLYVGNRHLRPFTELDGELLEEFAGYAALGLKRRAMENYRAGVIRRQERERFALDLHDSVVRGLVEIGFTAEASMAGATDPTLRGHLESIGLIAEQCMDKLRDQLDVLSADRDETLAQCPSSILAHIGEASHRPSAARTLELRGPDTALSPATADALVRIGQEALVNAETHAGGQHIHALLEITEPDAVLTVTDDGRGLDAAALDEVLAAAVPHLGFRAMRAAAAYVGGHLTVQPASPTGLTVRAVLPRRPARGPA